ncbi:MAG: Phosphoribosylaminoimidazole-succinocarboxamide synthase [candidate division TA06 bacterium 32_111]|uniref:Phosphoribosylaminoimidazole-succinocarboxamide synthase n=2 Tax=Bacteria candidate phyla TaxID=1783234 RepID=A0A124G0P1_UNCT6|nr:MAG: Phosphoribosylaminoimidazole-succinocarboxamide synthase [candidate division TA06 bacterium 32_111]KUK88121.1 MAG: Phosphoribosylaminoimidazole-succinocarboxamide synthase [candidate division TA06 bacterium 34_109]HAF07051.1 phosphoribosylaminoimidazolesuccinocarboxamide synthase [candidate division WOR-3 bacterium]HCP16966.1 phosphoribosylaminoimidazolesuccinocarboxamide synthase [candidate division WOR-3 bacterium]
MVVKETNVKELRMIAKGKVRDIYEFENDKLLIVTTDRISAFDYVLENGIESKGKVLNKLSKFFFDLTKKIVSNHFLYDDFDALPKDLKKYDYLKDRFMVVRKAKPIPFECIVRGYITGSAWSEYLKTQTVGGTYIRGGYVESEKFDEPLFTPTTKAEKGHDEIVSFEHMREKLGDELANKIKDLSLQLYRFGSEFLQEKNIILADTKFEFGLLDGNLIIIDEIFTPDSSRFWSAETYQVGKKQEPFDKQLIRNYLLSTDWDRKSQPPQLSDEIVQKTSEIYKKIYKIITDEELS